MLVFEKPTGAFAEPLYGSKDTERFFPSPSSPSLLTTHSPFNPLEQPGGLLRGVRSLPTSSLRCVAWCLPVVAGEVTCVMCQ